MKKVLSCCFRSLIVLVAVLFFSNAARANHIVGLDLNYTWVSGNTYKITLVVFGDCSGGAAYDSLPTATPQICVYNGATSVGNLTLAIQAPATGVNVSAVCTIDTGLTTCSGGTYVGIKKYTYSGNYTVSGPSHYWRFIFDGSLGHTQAGRATTITNIATGTTSMLTDTLDNTYHVNNSSPDLTVSPTPYYCLNNADNYSPGAVDPDGDSLHFYLAPGIANNAASCAGAATAASVTYNTGFSAVNPLSYTAGTFSFNANNGQIGFTPNVTQRALVVYSIREYRNDTFIGTSQREMTFLVQTCSNSSPYGGITSATNGLVIDSTDFQICPNTGPFSLTINPTEVNPTGLITVDTSGLPVGSTINITGNGTHAPVVTFNWTSTAVAPGLYTFYLFYKDNNCPIAGTNTYAINVDIANLGTINGTDSVCKGSTTTLTNTTSGGVWSSSNIAVATISTGGVVTGISNGTSTISYSVGTCFVTVVVTVNSPAAIATVPATVCLLGTTTLTDATAGGTWSSSAAGVASVGTGGVVTGLSVGTASISYTKNTCSATTVVTVNNAPVAITPSSASVCTGSTVTLTDTSSGGVWTSSSANATVAGGVVTGVTGGTTTISYAIGSCVSTAIVTINATPAAIATVPATICLGGTVTLTDGTVGGVWSSTTTSVATISTGGLVTGAGVGTSTISYTKTGCSATTVVTVNTAPVAILPAAPVVCTGSTITLTDATSGGVWSSTNTGVATVAGGIVTGVAAGTATMSYAIGTCVSTTIVTVNTTPAAIATVPVSLCLGGTVTLTDGTVGGVWSSSAAGVASVGTGGIVTAAGVGTATISYTKTGCSATTVATVNNAPVALSPTSAIVCTGNTTTFTDATGGGIWSSSASGVASVAGGVVTGVSVGTATITYAIGTCIATAPVTVNLSPNAGAITGPADVCPGNNITLTDGAVGGVWSASNGNATVAGGVVSGVTLGTDVISYTVGTACGSASALFTVNIAVTGSGTILGPNTICVGSFDIYLDTTGSGTWSLTNGRGVISSAGVVTALTTGADTIVYTSAGACAATTKAITIVPATGGGTITGPTSVCVGSNITLADAVSPGGTWTASNSRVTVGLSTGVVTGVSAGLDTITYIVTTVCGTYTNTATVNVDASSTPSPISGPSSVCATSSITLSDADAGGIFSSSNGNATVVSGSGVVTGVLPGMDTITYTVINGCGLGATTKVITVIPAPSAGTITGPLSVCVGAVASFTDAISGGTWAVTNGNATITAAGSVTGLVSGTDTIIYTITAGCGTVSSTKVITINPLPNAGTITGPDSVCIGATITLTDATTGGLWTAGNGNATVTGTGGVVTGVAAGTVPVSYAVTNTCGTNYAVQVVNVVGMPDAGVITGISNVCVGAAITLIDTVPGGIWLSSNGNAAIIGPGIVSGVTTGVDSIFYVVINSCGTVEARKIINVNPSPAIPAIVGATSQCAGTTITLTDGLAGGSWTSSNAGVAVAGISTGSITGASAGIVTISYTVTNAFGCPATVTAPDTVNIIPVVAAPAGATSVCMLSSVALTDATSGGVWSSGNTAIATVDAIGNVTGVAAGGVIISYTVTNMCGATSGTIAFTVNPLPVVGVIAGTTNECTGSSATLTDIPAGGTWGSLDTAIATVNSATGVVTGVTPGVATIIYSITNTFGCVTTVSTQDTVAAPPAVLPISGATNECIGATTTLTDGTGGGVWSSSDNTIATVDATGKVLGVAVGVVTISYSVTNLSGCTSYVTMSFTVNTMPVASAILGSGSVCQGGIDSLSNATTGGAWSSSDVTIATIDPVSGALTGVGAGNVTIKYNIVNSCGSVTDSVVISVIAAPVVAPVTALYTTICSGSNITVSDATSGGIWSTSNAAIATVGSTGLVTSLSVGSVTISYTVTNVSGCATSATYALTVTNPLPSVNVVPATGTLCHGNPVNMHVSAAIAGVTYQWLLNGNAIAGATNSGYVTDTPGTYSLVISNGLCSETLPGTVVSGPPVPVVSFMTPDILYTGSFFSYQWYKDGAAIAGATTSLVHETGPGIYMVVITDINGCTDTGSYSVPWISTSVAGITTGSSIRVYPNPATSLLTIDAPVKVNVSVLSIDGKTLIGQKAATSVDVSSLASGMYMIMIYDENNLLLMTSRFVKEGQ